MKGLSKIKLRNKRWEDDYFLNEQKKVLAEHSSGKDVDLDEAVEYHRNLPEGKILINVLTKAREEGDTCLIAGMGHTDLMDQIELLQNIQNEGKAHFLGTTVDSFTRDHDFETAERGLKESLETGRSVLNGLPVCAHGLSGVRKLVESIEIPIQSRFASYDPRIIHEILFAGGHTGNSGSAMFSFWNYNKRISLETVLHNYQYIYKLQAYYQERGCPMCDCPYGMSPVLTPPSSAIIAQLTQCLMMAEQGIKYLLVAMPLQGNLVQDVACAKTYFRLARHYLDRFGYTDVDLFHEVYYIFGRFPANPIDSFIITSMNLLAAKLIGAQVAYIRTLSEHGPIPQKEDYAASYRAANTTRNLLKEQNIELDCKKMLIESEMFEREVRFIFDRMLDMADGDSVVAIARGIESGLLDNPWGTHPSVACKISGVRDAEGAVRYYDTGNIPFPKDIKKFHKEKIAERSKREGRKVDYSTVVYDILAVGEGTLIKRVGIDT
jgi:methylaspartate mutase epsilon subunit